MDISKDMMWALLLHLGYNMWNEEDSGNINEKPEYINASSTLLCDTDTWNEITDKMTDNGLNTLIIDIGEGLKYESHPELAVKGSWSPEQLKKEIARLRGLGIKLVPKLNFSACHDEWLGEYSRCVSTKKYYDVCKDLINEVIDLFDNPEYFHLGMDEETFGNQMYHNYAIVRNGDAWWKDFYYLVDLVEKRNVRSWIWSDYIWNNKELFLKKMPKSVLQSNWYYNLSFTLNGANGENKYLQAYHTLEEYGYDQVPTGSNWSCTENFERTVGYCKEFIEPKRLKGYMQAPWNPTVKKHKYFYLHALELVSYAKKKYYL